MENFAWLVQQRMDWFMRGLSKTSFCRADLGRCFNVIRFATRACASFLVSINGSLFECSYLAAWK